MALAVCLLWQALRLMKKPAVGTGLLFSFFGALAANTKVVGIALWGLCALAVLAEQIIRRRMNGRVWAVAGVTFGAFFAFYALLTPALWADPAAFVQYLVVNALGFQRWQNLILFRGTVFDLQTMQLPVYYLPYMILATTPLWILLLIALGAFRGGLRVIRCRSLPMTLVWLMWALPLGFAVLTRTTVYNGWRHFYFVYGPMLVLAVWGVDQLCRKKRIRRILAAVLAVCMLGGGMGLLKNHPHQQAYYQPLVRFCGADYNELDYWNVSARNALQALAVNTEGDIAIAPADLWTEDALKKGVLLLDEETAVRFAITDEAQYVLVNPTYRNFSGAETAGKPVVELTSYGQPIMQIYEKERQ